MVHVDARLTVYAHCRPITRIAALDPNHRDWGLRLEGHAAPLWVGSAG